MKGEIKVINLSKKFKKRKILTNINLKISSGDFVGLVGESGSGKSVFLKTILGFYKPTNGKIIVSGKMGFSAQNNSLYETLTIKQNLDYFASIYEIPNKEMMISWMLDGLKIREYENTKVKNVSGGTKKRVDIACALIKNPDILILDEPFTGLSFSLIQGLGIFLKKLQKEGVTIILASHNATQIEKLCNRFILMENCTIKEISLKELKEKYRFNI